MSVCGSLIAKRPDGTPGNVSSVQTNIKRYFLTLFLCCIASTFSSVFAQTTINTTVGSSGYTGTNSGGTGQPITFIISNTSPVAVLLTDVGDWTSSTDNGKTFTLYYSTSSLSGTPGTLTTPTWNQIASNTVSGIGSSTLAVNTVISGMNFLIPANTMYRFALHTTGSRRYSGTGPGTASPNTFTSNGVALIVGDFQINSAYVGYGATNSPRFFTGSITFVPALPCVSPPTAGVGSASASNVCSGSTIQLSLTGNSMGTGQTYQWEGSASATGPFTAVAAAAPSPSLSTTITSSTYYRAAVTCGASTVYSDTILVTTPPLFAGGTYTIDVTQPASSTNFQSFAAAASAINCGISGPVVFNVAAGTYTNDQFLLDDINTTATNTITVNGNGATLSFVSTNTAERAGIRLNGTDHLTVNNLNIVATGNSTSEYGYGIHLTNSADSNTFANCTISVDSTISSTNYVPVVMSGSLSSPTTAGSNCDWNTFTGNTLNGGYYSMVMYGNSAAPLVTNNTITNNVIKNFYAYGIYLYGNNAAHIEGNDISRPTRTTSTTFAGIIFSGLNRNVNFTRNKIHNGFDAMPTSTSTSYPIYTSSSDATLGNENIISNNLIYDINSSGTIYGIYNSGSNYYKYYHNTISLDDPNTATTSNTRGIYQTSSATGLEFFKNIISIKRGGSGVNYAMYMNTSSTTWTANSNNYHVAGAGTNHVGYSGGSQTTLANWQTATGQDAASWDLPGLFSNAIAGDYTPGNAALDNLGTPVGITTDILNTPRSTTTPDLGAYEFTVPMCMGQPTAGTAFINADDTARECNGGNLSLTLQGFSIGAGIVMQWESSPVGQANWVAIPGAVNPIYNTTMAGPMDYRVIVTCQNGGFSAISNTVVALANPFYFCYCGPNTGTTLHTSTSNYTTNVEIPGTSLNHSTTSVGPGGYTFADPTISTNTATLSMGVPYTLNVTQSSTNANGEAWVDWDKNGVFDATEYYQLTKSGTISSGTITPPLTALTGLTGMRVRTIYSTTVTFGASGACSNVSTGRETQDYVITIGAAPTCFPPSGILSSAVTATAATITWTAAATPPANGYEYYYSTTNTNPAPSATPSGSVGAGITTAPLSGLTPVTTYYVWVRGVCGANDVSVWSGPESFTTACAPFTAPYTHDVESQTANTNSVMTACWNSLPTNSTGVYAWHVTGTGTTGSTNTGPNAAHSGSKYFFTEASYGSLNATAQLTTPLVNVSSLTTPMLEFWYHMYGPDMNKLIIEVFNGTTWNAIDSIVGQQQTAETDPWLVRNIVLSGYTGNIQARFTGVRGSSFGGDISIDDISFIQAPSCPAPSALSATAATSSASLDWTEQGSATQWQLEYGTIGFTQGSGTSAFVTTKPHPVSGLSSATQYDFYVRSICGPNDTSAWSGPMTFATIPPNDTCQNAVNITNGQVFTGTTAGATESMTSCNAATTTANDVWYSFTTGSVGGSVTVTVTTTGTMDVVMQGLSGTCGALTGMVPTASTTLTGTCIDGPAVGSEFGTYTVSPFTTYYVRVFGYVGAQGSFTIQATGTPLSIKLGGIKAMNVDNRNRIDWSSLSEDAGDYYELERSIDGRNFTTLTSVPAEGKASQYTYWDNEPVAGRNYYRLNMKTANGGSVYSEVVTAVMNGKGSFVVEALPNPVTDRVTVKLSGQQGADASILLTDISGKVIKVINSVSSETVIDMNNLAGGLYFIKYTDNQHSETIRVNKL